MTIIIFALCATFIPHSAFLIPNYIRLTSQKVGDARLDTLTPQNAESGAETSALLFSYLLRLTSQKVGDARLDEKIAQARTFRT
ncbi:MAG: hypothetical protein IJU10_04700 [Clostridia bacterium]|nr:hypothetical protein [Clostridia bacterium]